MKLIDDNHFICHLYCIFSDFFYHQYGICCMYSKENPQDFRLPVPCLYP